MDLAGYFMQIYSSLLPILHAQRNSHAISVFMTLKYQPSYILLAAFGVVEFWYRNLNVIIELYGTSANVHQEISLLRTWSARLVFQSFISLFGTPRLIIMDTGKNFKTLSLPIYLASVGIENHYSTGEVHIQFFRFDYIS